MKKVILSCLSFLLLSFCFSQPLKGYQSLDASHPINFGGSYIVYDGDTVPLGPKAFFVDGQLSDAEVANYPYVFNTVNKAVEKLTDGTEAAPMILYMAPWVYWIDNPDAPAIREGEGGAPPYGLVIKCEWLHFYGLSPNPRNVVLASNRGQTIGARGNFTMFKFIGQGTGSENITFGNYCNIDLVYPLKPTLNREKRAAATVQAQLIHCNGDKIVARNTRFVSRLNLCPFVGGKRVLFDRCHFESTDDALCGTGVYLNSTLDFYGSKPFFNTRGTGAVFLNCDLRSFTRGRQFFTKANGQVAVVDSRIKTAPGTYLGWNEVVPAETRNYQYRVTQNGKPVNIGNNDPAATVDMSGKRVLDAYRVVQNGKTVYNTYNLLKGDDDWDPMDIKPLVLAAEKASHTSYTNLPVQLLVSPSGVAVETGKDEVKLTARTMRFGNYELGGQKINWRVAPASASLVKLVVSDDGSTCTVIPTNRGEEVVDVVITASTASGLEAASLISVVPPVQEAPGLVSAPTIVMGKQGNLLLNYQLNTNYKDQSLVTWYRCRDASGADPIEVAVSRFNEPLIAYTLTTGDIGYYIMAAVAPKHTRSKAGERVQVVLSKPITASDVKTPYNLLVTDFRNLSVSNQPKVLPGFWTWDHLDVPGNEQRFITDKTKDAWYFGEGSDGAAGMTGLLQGRSAGMYFTPVGGKFGDMKLTMVVAPYKTAGQGFSVAHLYMDVLFKFDTQTMTGYALRFIRTTKYHDAVDCMLVKYENGVAVPVSEPVSTTSFKTTCTIIIEVTNNNVVAKATTTAEDHAPSRDNLKATVDLTSAITPNEFGGFGTRYNGGSPTMIKEMKVEWK